MSGQVPGDSLTLQLQALAPASGFAYKEVTRARDVDLEFQKVVSTAIAGRPRTVRFIYNYFHFWRRLASALARCFLHNFYANVAFYQLVTAPRAARRRHRRAVRYGAAARSRWRPRAQDPP